MTPNPSVLNSWKEIASYLGRGVRTVQRWERDFGLPVHRPGGKKRAATLALPSELDEWLRRTPLRSLGEYPDPEHGGAQEPNPQPQAQNSFPDNASNSGNVQDAVIL